MAIPPASDHLFRKIKLDRMIEPDSSEGLSIHASVGYAQRNTQAQSHNHGGQAYEKATVCGNGRP